MKLSRRPRRYIVIPPPRADEPVPSAARAARLVQALPAAPRPAHAREPAAVPRAGAIKVVNRSPADGSVLVEARGGLALEQLKAHTPPGVQVVEEQWYRLERPARPWSRSGATLKAPRVRAGRSTTWSVTVVVDGTRRRLRDALVTVMVDEARGIGLEATTDRRGRAAFLLSDATTDVDAVYVDPLHGGWPVRLAGVSVAAGALEIAAIPIDTAAADVRGLVYDRPPAGAGKHVRVGVVDTGVGPHAALVVAGGRNTTTGESPLRTRDENGHGTHVAGVIAARADGWRRGEASAVELHAYRIFEAGDPYASTFAISAAIKQAAVDGCDLVNLSIGDSMADDSVRDAVEFAWSLGCVCIAATGNDGKAQVDYPARYPRAVAVSAIGLVGAWPAGAYLEWAIGKARGSKLDGRRTFFASFSNRGAKVGLTAPGVGVVSTIFGGRWGVMSGTSMATPIATGVLARRLAGAAGVLAMPRDGARAAAIVQLAAQAAEDLHMPAGLQGRGLAR